MSESLCLGAESWSGCFVEMRQISFSGLTWQTSGAKLHPKFVGFHSRRSASRFN